jgi:hypothetical protein
MKNVGKEPLHVCADLMPLFNHHLTSLDSFLMEMQLILLSEENFRSLHLNISNERSEIIGSSAVDVIMAILVSMKYISDCLIC